MPDAQPEPEHVFHAIAAYADFGKGYWRLAEVDVSAIEGVPAIARSIASGRPPAEAIDAGIARAIQAMTSPHAEAALENLGFSPEARRIKGRVTREDRAAAAINVDGRTYRRTETQRDERSSSYRDQVLWAVVDALFGLPDAPPRPCVLYVEDDDAFIDIVRQALPDYEVEPAQSLGAALQSLEDQGPRYALALIDANLTNRDDRAGYEVLEYIAAKLPDLPRILITASRLTGPINSDLISRYGLSELLIKDSDLVPGLRRSVARAIDGSTT